MLLYALYYAVHNAPDNPRMNEARDCKQFNDIFLKALQRV